MTFSNKKMIENKIIKKYKIKNGKKKGEKIYLFIELIIKICIIMMASPQCLKLYFFFNKYHYCNNCVKNIKHLSAKCHKCPNEFLFRKLYIESEENTLNEIIKHNKSISRYGDGEFLIIFKRGISFQNYFQELAKRLLEILNSHDKNLLVGIYYPYKAKDLKPYIPGHISYWKAFTNGVKFHFFQIIKQDKKFYSAGISRFYFKFKDKSISKRLLSKFRQIWGGRDVLIIEGEISKLGVGNDLFNNTNSIKRIICPEKNSFRVYNKILKTALNFEQNNLILISLGPTATVLAYDLSKLGYQALDIGHIDREYELMIKKEKRWIFKGEKKPDVSGKEMIKYKNQIKYKILK